MSELSKSQCHYSNLLISNLIRLSSFILYFLFFTPFLLKLISFLSPIILTASLLFLARFVFTASSKLHFPSILERFHFKKLDSPNEEHHRSDDLSMYEIFFGPPSMAREENDPPQLMDQTPQQDPNVGNSKSCVAMASNVEEMKKKPEPTNGAKSDKVVEKQKPLLMNGSEAAACNNNISNDVAAKFNLEERSSVAKSQSQDHDDENKDGDDEKSKVRGLDRKNSLWSEGSMRREREWERTLACKLFEERRDVGGGGEGMDSLWEAYEMEEDSAVGRRRSEKMRREKIWEEEDEEIGGQLCCLQALKLSAGKMILGVGKPNLVKISKAIKGVGWLHKTTKNSKKVHNHGGDHRY